MRSLVLLLVGLLGGVACTSFAGAEVPEEEGNKPSGVAGKGGQSSGTSGQGGSSAAGGSGGQGGAGKGGSTSGAGGSGGGGAGPGGSGAGGSAGASSGGSSGSSSGGAGGSVLQGWQGPFRVEQASLGQEPPGFESCGAQAALVLVAGVDGPSPCTPCACGAMTGVTCNGGGVAYALGAADCLAVNMSKPSQDWSSTCFEFSAPTNGKITAVPLQTSTQGGSCPPQGGVFQPKNYTGETYRLCAGDPGAGEQRCLLGPAGAPCPEGWPSAKAVAEGFSDNRSCGSCSCEPQQKPSCNTDEFDLMLAAGCLDFGPFPHVGQQCQTFDFGSQDAGKTWSMKRIPATPQGAGSCTPKGGGVLGSVLLEKTATLCCAD